MLKKLLGGTAIVVLAAVFVPLACKRSEAKASELYKFDASGRLIEYTRPDGFQARWAFDQASSTLEEIVGSETAKYGLAPDQSVTWIRDNTGITEYAFDASGQLSGVLWRHSPFRYIDYEYDHQGQLKRVGVYNLEDPSLGRNSPLAASIAKLAEPADKSRVPAPERQLELLTVASQLRAQITLPRPSWLEHEVEYSRDVLGRLTAIQSDFGRVQYSYAKDRPEIERRLPNGVVSRFQFGQDGSLLSLEHRDPSGSLIAQYRYTRDPAGRLSSAEETDGPATRSATYSWSKDGKLDAVRVSDGSTVRFGYDPTGRLSQIGDGGTSTTPVAYGKDGRLSRVGSAEMQYRKDGFLSGYRDASQNLEFKYDARGMVEAVKTKEEETKFRWDREGNLISRTTGGKTLHSLPMPGSSYHLGDFGDDGRIATRYLPGDGRLIARMASLGKPEFFLEDGLGATRHTVSESGRPVPSAQPPVRRATVSDMFPMGVSRPAGASPRPSRIDSVSRPQLTHFEMPPRPQMPARPVLPEMSSRQQRPVHYTAPADAYWKAEPLEELVERGVPLPRLDPADYVKNFGIATSSILLSTLQGGVSHIPAVKEVPFLGSVLAPAVEAMRIEIVRHADPSVRQNLDRAQDAMKQGFGAVSVVTDAKDILSSSMKPAEWFQLRGYNTKSWVQHATFDAPPSTVRITTRNANEMVDGVSIWSRQGLGFNLDFPAFGKKAMEVFAKKAIRDTFYGELNELKTTTPALHDKSQPAIQARRPVEPFDGISKQLGGIELAAEAQVAGDLGQIHGAVYDPQTESIVLAGDESTGGTGIQAEDFAFALKLAYAEPPIDPQFSLDPDDPGNPSGAWQKAVYIPEEVLAGTSFGLALFEADWLLKQYAFGVRLDAAGYQHALRSRVPGFQSVADLSLGRSSGSPEKQSWNRFWIVSSEMKIRREGNSIVFDAPKMAVKAKKQVPDPKSRTGLRDVESSDDPDASRFAKFFTDHYDEIALEAPEFGRVRELAKAVAIAKWLRSMNVPIDREWVEKASSRRIPVPGKVTTLSTKWSVETRTPFEKEGRRGEAILTNSLRLSGGVDLTVQPSYVKDDNRAKTLFEGVQEKRKEQADSRVLSLEKGEFPRAIILPLSPTARKREGERKTVVAGGTEWKLNEQGRVAKGKTASGEETRYSYDASGRLAKVELEGKTGPRAWGERDADGSTWTFPDALGNQVKFHFSSDGSTIRLSGNAETIAEFSTSASGDETRWVKDGVTVSRSFDNEGRLQGGRITQKGPGSQSWDQPFSVTYGSDGRPASVDLPNLATTAWKYPAAPKPETGRASVTRRLMTGHETPATDEVEMTASTPFGQLAVKRGPDGAVREIRSSTGEELAFLDRPGETGKIRYRNAAREVEWTEEKGQSVFTEKLTGAGAAARPAVRKTVVLHDAERRITEVRYPDGTQASYSYREVPAAAGSKGPETHVSVVWSQAKGR